MSSSQTCRTFQQTICPSPPTPLHLNRATALDGGPDGLRLYRELLSQLPPLLDEDSLVLLEAAPPTIHALATNGTLCTPLTSPSRSSADYAGLPRYVRAQSVPRGYAPPRRRLNPARSQEGESAGESSAGERTRRSPSVRGGGT